MTTGTIEGEFIATMDDPDDPEMFARNRIHTTSGAQEYGFQGAFVGGVTLYAWCIPTVIEALGQGWLDHGWVNIRFRRPTYPGAHIRVQVTPKSESGAVPTRVGTAQQPEDAPACVLEALQDDGQASIVGEVGLGTAPWLGDLRETPFSAPDRDGPDRDGPDLDGPGLDGSDRPFLTLENAPIGQPLRAYGYGKHTPAAPAVGQKLAEVIDLATPTGAVVHPATLAREMIALLTNSYDYGHPSIHLTSHVQNFARIPADTDVVLCGTFVDAFERNGHHNAVIDADLYSLDGQRLARQRHTNIFKVRRARETD